VTLQFLEHLGWQVVEDPAVREVTIVDGKIGWRASIEASRAAGDLRIVVPAGRASESAPQLSALLPGIADSIPTRLAWQHRVRIATEAVCTRLAAAADRGTYSFPRLLGITSPVFVFEPPAGLWSRQGDLYTPVGSPSAAIVAFESKSCLAECLVAQMVATLAIQRELLGSEAFDEAYSAADATVGSAEQYMTTPIGHSLAHPGEGPWQALLLTETEAGSGDVGAQLARYGPMAFPGLTGILQDEKGTTLSNDNFVLVSVSEAACETLRTKGGYAYVTALTREWRQADAAERQPFQTAAKLKPFRERAAAIESDPVMTGIRLYIHPYGIETLGHAVGRPRHKNRTASEIYPYTCARDDEYFRRYRDTWIRRRARGAEVPQ
jgi:hypothetical protein